MDDFSTQAAIYYQDNLSHLRLPELAKEFMRLSNLDYDYSELAINNKPYCLDDCMFTKSLKKELSSHITTMYCMEIANYNINSHKFEYEVSSC